MDEGLPVHAVRATIELAELIPASTAGATNPVCCQISVLYSVGIILIGTCTNQALICIPQSRWRSDTASSTHNAITMRNLYH